MKMKFGVDLGTECTHDLCDCIKNAIEKKVLPAVYDRGYYEGTVAIIGALDSIIDSYQRAKKQGISDAKFTQVMTKRLAQFVSGSGQSKPGDVSVEDVSGKEGLLN